jgi:hypothetical protein
MDQLKEGDLIVSVTWDRLLGDSPPNVKSDESDWKKILTAAAFVVTNH